MSHRPNDLDAVHQALLKAFPSRSALAQFVYFQLGVNLEEISSLSTLSQTVFELLTWAESGGRFDALVVGARRANPGNPALREVAVRLGLDSPAEPPAPAPPATAPPTDPQSLRRSLREALSVLYPSASDAARVAADVGLPRSHVDFSGSANNVWFNVIEEASKRDLLVQLVNRALEEYPQNGALSSLRSTLVGGAGS